MIPAPGQGLACGAGCWLPEGVSDPAPLPPQYLLGHWFLSRSLPQIISDLLLPLDFVDAPQTGVEECLDLLVASSVLSAMSLCHHNFSVIAIPFHRLVGLVVKAVRLQSGRPGVRFHCDWMRQKIGSATSISVRQNVTLSGQIRP